MPDVRVCRAIWAALELGGSRTLDELKVTTGVEPEQTLQYLGLLMRHDYVRMVGVRRAGSGEAVPVFRLVRRTGPETPYLDLSGWFVDPNQRALASARHRTNNAPRKPSLSARLRVAAERLSSFTRDQLRAVIFGPHPTPVEGQWFTAAFGQMLLKGHVQAAGNGSFSLVKGFDPAVDAIREELRKARDTAVSVHDLTAALGFSPTGPQMRHATDLLKAEGYKVIRTNGAQRAATLFKVSQCQ